MGVFLLCSQRKPTDEDLPDRDQKQHMPPKRHQRRRQRGGLARLAAQVATLKQEARRDNTGGYNRKTHCIAMPPWGYAPKFFRTVRLQNSTVATNNIINIRPADILQNISPAFELFQIVSVTVYGPYIASSGMQIASTNAAFSSEFSFYPSVSFNPTGGTGEVSHSGPSKFVSPAAGRRGCVHWMWSATDQTVSFDNYTGTFQFAQIRFENAASDNVSIQFRKNTYIDVTVKAWGRRESFVLLDGGAISPYSSPGGPMSNMEDLSTSFEDILSAWALTGPKYDLKLLLARPYMVMFCF